jgi:hypothetical protein
MTVPISVERYSFRKKHRKKDIDVKQFLDTKNDTYKVNQTGGALSRSASTYRNRSINRISNRSFTGTMLQRAKEIRTEIASKFKQNIQSALSKRTQTVTADKSGFMTYVNNLYSRLNTLNKTKSTILNDRVVLLDDSSSTKLDTNTMSDSIYTQIKSSQTEVQQNIARFELLAMAGRVSSNEQANVVNTMFNLESQTSNTALATIASRYTSDLISRRKNEIISEYSDLQSSSNLVILDLAFNMNRMQSLRNDVTTNINFYTPKITSLIQTINSTSIDLEAQVINAYIGLYNMQTEMQTNRTSLIEVSGKLTLSNLILQQISARFVPPLTDITPYSAALSTAEANKNNFSPQTPVQPSIIIPTSIAGKISAYLSDIKSRISGLTTIITQINTSLTTAKNKLVNLPGEISTSLNSYRTAINNLNSGLLTATQRGTYEANIQKYRDAESTRDAAINRLNELGDPRNMRLNPDMPVFTQLNSEYSTYTGYINELNTTTVQSYLDAPVEKRYDALTDILVYQRGLIITQRSAVDTASSAYTTLISDLNTAYDTFVSNRDSFFSQFLIARPSTAQKDAARGTYTQQIQQNSDSINNFKKNVSDNFKALYFSIRERSKNSKNDQNSKSKFNDASTKRSSISPVVRLEDASTLGSEVIISNLTNQLEFNRNILLQQSALTNIYSRRTIVELERPPLENSESINMNGYIMSLNDSKNSNERSIQAVLDDIASIPTSRTSTLPDPAARDNALTARDTALTSKRALEGTNIDLGIRSQIILVKYKSEISVIEIRKLTVQNNTNIASDARNFMRSTKSTNMGFKNSNNTQKLSFNSIISQMRSVINSSISSINTVFTYITNSKNDSLSVKTLLINESANLESARFKLMTDVYGSTVTLPLVIKLQILQTIDNLKQNQAVNRDIYIQDMLNITYPTRTLPDTTSVTTNLETKYNLLSIATSSYNTINATLNAVKSLLNTHIYSRIMISKYKMIGGIKAVGTQSISMFYASKNTFNMLLLTARQRTIELSNKFSNIKNNLQQIVSVTSNVNINTKPVTPSRTAIDNVNTSISQLLKMNMDINYRLSFLYNSFKQVDKNLKIALSSRDYSAVLSRAVRSPMKLLSNATKTSMYSSALSVKNSIVVSVLTKYGIFKQSLNNLKGLLLNKLNQYANYVTTSRLDIFDKNGSLKSLRGIIQSLRAERTKIESQIISLKTQESILMEQIKSGYNFNENTAKLNEIRNKLNDLQNKLNDINNRIRDEQKNMERLKKEIDALKKLRDNAKKNDSPFLSLLGPAVGALGGIAVIGSITGLFSSPINPAQGTPQARSDGSNPDDSSSLDNGRGDGTKDGNTQGYLDGERDGLAEAQRQYKIWKSKNPDDTTFDRPEEGNEAEEEVEEADEEDAEAEGEAEGEADAEGEAAEGEAAEGEAADEAAKENSEK